MKLHIWHKFYLQTYKHALVSGLCCTFHRFTMTWWMVCKCLQTSWGLPSKLMVTSVICLQPKELHTSLWPNATTVRQPIEESTFFFLKTSGSQVVCNQSLAVCDLNKQELWLWLLPLYSLTGAYWLHGLINVFWASSAARGLNNKAGFELI